MRHGERKGDPRVVPWLVLRAQAGDRDALEQLLRAAERMLRPYFAGMIRDPDVRADALQETLVILYRRLGSLREPRAFGAWARRIASREIFRVVGRKRREERLHEDLGADHPGDVVDPEPLASAVLPRIEPLLERISPASRAVLVLHYVDGLTLVEIAAILDLPVGTIKSRLGYGLSRLRRLLSAEPVG